MLFMFISARGVKDLADKISIFSALFLLEQINNFFG